MASSCYSSADDELRLVQIGQATVRLLDRCEDTVSNTEVSIRCWLRSQHRHQTYKASFELLYRGATPRRSGIDRTGKAFSTLLADSTAWAKPFEGRFSMSTHFRSAHGPRKVLGGRLVDTGFGGCNFCSHITSGQLDSHGLQYKS